MNHEDPRDPLQAAVDSYRLPPRDVVPHRSIHRPVDDLKRLAEGRAEVTVSHYEMTEHGVTRHMERVTITNPITYERDEDL